MDTIPTGCEAEFVGEGAANLVFKITPPNNSSSPAFSEGKLLRVPKAGTRAYPYPELQEYWENTVKPLFKGDDLVQQSLVRLTGSGIVPKLNALLSENEANRREDFRGHRVADAEFGMLVENMRKIRPGDIVLEFKPKWLAQSPSAPPTSRRCRNCALVAYRSHSSSSNNNDDAHGTSKAALCPLDLARCHDDTAVLRQVLGHMMSLIGGRNAAALPEPQLGRFAEWLETNGLIERLRAAQVRNDPGGPLGSSAHDSRFQLAMTLRDCACFIRIPADAGAPVEVRLGDMDRKNSEAKLGYWQSMERRLIDGGYYEGREEPAQRTACQLERE